MRRAVQIFFLLILNGLLSCTVAEEPTFVRVQDVELTKVDKNEYLLQGDLVYHNPNDLGGTITGLNLDLQLDEYPLGALEKDLAVEIKANSEFNIPLNHTLNFSELKVDQQLISLLIGAAFNKKVEFAYKGDVTLKIAGVKFTLPVENKETIPFSKK